MRRRPQILRGISRPSSLCFAAILLTPQLFGAVFGVAAERELPPAATRKVDFRADVFPLLSNRCFECHQGADAESGVRLDDLGEVLGETTGEPLVLTGKSADSLLVQLVAGADADKVMPPKGPRLTTDEIATLRAWIDQGVAWDSELLPPLTARSMHWAFQPVLRPSLPQIAAAAWCRNSVDAFVAAGHAERGYSPAAETDRRVLIRRLWLDLLGLPPSVEAVQAFIADPAPDAYERLVDRLLASPQYGERWGRHWLDVARWAETEGYESNHPRSSAWRYRDYVVASFNRDHPYDKFVRQQLAGDELTPYSDENLTATGFLAAARLSSNEEDKHLQRNDVLVDVVNAVGNAFLGLTVQCAQCHNHKFDPITIRDYYRLQGYFLPGQPVTVALRDEPSPKDSAGAPPEYEPARQLLLALQDQGRAAFIAQARGKMSAEMRQAYDTPADQRTVTQELLARKADIQFQLTREGIERNIPEAERSLYNELKKRVAEWEKKVPPLPQTFAYYSPVTSPHGLRVLPALGFYPLPFEPAELAQLRPYIHVRGDVHNIGPKLEAGWPAVFDANRPAASAAGTQSLLISKPNRTQLADWLTDRQHPLTARVWANRVWHYHFGRGIVATPSDFGTRGAAPSNPQLLDWLAAELADSGWSTKRLHRLMITSATYRQASTINPRQPGSNAENEFLTHWTPRRLEVETIRDAMLAVSGQLDAQLGGVSVQTSAGEESLRRSIYQFQKRGITTEMQRLFDGPVEVAESCQSRHCSTTALQSLFLLNNEFARNRARAVADLVKQEARSERSRQIELAFARVLQRMPDAEELHAAAQFFAARAENGADRAAADDEALVAFCQALLNLNEFAYLE